MSDEKNKKKFANVVNSSMPSMNNTKVESSPDNRP